MAKQVIVVNMAVPMGIGRLVAQAAHASVAVLLDKGSWNNDGDKFEIDKVSDPMQYWMKESFTKIVCKSWGESELMKLYDHAKELGLPCSTMIDDGHLTAIAIGPDKIDLINSVTGELPLL